MFGLFAKNKKPEQTPLNAEQLKLNATMQEIISGIHTVVTDAGVTMDYRPEQSVILMSGFMAGFETAGIPLSMQAEALRANQAPDEVVEVMLTAARRPQAEEIGLQAFYGLKEIAEIRAKLENGRISS